MLSFMVQNPTKPVVITGAMKPITEPGSDAVKNLRDSLLFAMEAKIGGIFVVFNGKVMNGCRVSKINSVDVDAFKSINYPDIAYIDEGGQIKYNANILDSYSRPRGSLKLDTQYDPRVFVLKLIPGLDSRVIDGLLDMGYKGLILESYGTGGIPYRKRNLLEKIKSISREIPVVVTTQALYGGVDLSRYEVGMKALEAGVISAKDMTKEATVTKLMWALGHTEDVDEIKQIMHTNYADEIKNISQ
jgi:L-asparaginase